MGQTELALMIALISVGTAFMNVASPLLKSPGSDIQLLFESLSDNEVTFLVRNEGRSGGVLRLDALFIIANYPNRQYGSDGFRAPFTPNGTYLESGREQRLSFQFKDPLGAHFQNFLAETKYVEKSEEEAGPHWHSRSLITVHMAGLNCAFEVRETSFKSKGLGKRDVPIDCRLLPVIYEAVNGQGITYDPRDWN